MTRARLPVKSAIVSPPLAGTSPHRFIQHENHIREHQKLSRYNDRRRPIVGDSWVEILDAYLGQKRVPCRPGKAPLWADLYESQLIGQGRLGSIRIVLGEFGKSEIRQRHHGLRTY